MTNSTSYNFPRTNAALNRWCTSVEGFELPARNRGGCIKMEDCPMCGLMCFVYVFISDLAPMIFCVDIWLADLPVWQCNQEEVQLTNWQSYVKLDW